MENSHMQKISTSPKGGDIQSGQFVMKSRLNHQIRPSLSQISSKKIDIRQLSSVLSAHSSKKIDQLREQRLLSPQERAIRKRIPLQSNELSYTKHINSLNKDLEVTINQQTRKPSTSIMKRRIRCSQMNFGCDLQSPSPRVMNSELKAPRLFSSKQNDVISSFDSLFCTSAKSPRLQLSSHRSYISSLTQSVNTHASQVYQQISDMQLNSKQQVEDLNCHELFRKTAFDIKTLNYQANKLVSNQSVQKEILIDRPQEIDAIPGEKIYYRVHIRGVLEVIKFTIIMPQITAQIKPDLNIYMSSKYREPTEQKSSQALTNVNKFAFNRKDTNIWQEVSDYLYLGFYSLVGCTFTICASFPPPQDPKQKQKKNVNYDDIDSKLKKFLGPKLLEAPAPLTNLNFDYLNKSSAFTYSQALRQHKIREAMIRFQTRLAQVTLRREQQVESVRAKNQNNLRRWDLYKQLRMQKERQDREVAANIEALKQLLRVLIIWKSCKRQRANILRRLNARNMIVKMRKVATMVKRAMMRSLIKRGKNMIQRFKRDIKSSMNFMGMSIISEMNEKANVVLQEFLKETNVFYEMKEKMLNFRQRMVNIQDSYRHSLNQHQGRLMFLQYFWANLKVDLSKILLGNKKHPKESQKASVKIFSISDKVRDHYLKAYLKLCRDVQIVKFIEWRRRNRKFAAPYAPENRDLLDDYIPKYLTIIEENEDFLFKELDQIIQNCINESVDHNVSSHGVIRRKTSFTFKQIDHIKKRANKASFITQTSSLEEKELQLQEQEPFPHFVFMPSKLQLMTMIVNAAYFNQ